MVPKNKKPARVEEEKTTRAGRSDQTAETPDYLKLATRTSVRPSMYALLTQPITNGATAVATANASCTHSSPSSFDTIPRAAKIATIAETIFTNTVIQNSLVFVALSIT